jgi:IS5 family transposase
LHPTHLVSDRRGIPHAVVLSAANDHDSMVFEELIDAVEPIKRTGRVRPRKRPEKLHADKAYDDDKKRKRALRWRRIKSRIARKGVESSKKLGRHRWVVERTLARSNVGSRFAISTGAISMRRLSISVFDLS